MQTIPTQLTAIFHQAIQEAFGFDADPVVGLGQNPQFGDYQANCAMGLSKLVTQKTGAKTNPRAVAQAMTKN